MVDLCLLEYDAENFMVRIAKESHAALLVAPDSSFYDMISGLGWNGLVFDEGVFDHDVLRREILAIMDNQPSSHSATPKRQSTDRMSPATGLSISREMSSSPTGFDARLKSAKGAAHKAGSPLDSFEPYAFPKVNLLSLTFS